MLGAAWGQFDLCGGKRGMARYRQIIVEGQPVGLLGLDDVFKDLQAQGRHPQESDLGMEMVQRLSKDNYIPPSARQGFALALTREYAAFLNRAEGTTASGKRSYGTWRGYPREQIPWYPIVDEDLCDGCGVCLKLCSVGALQPTDNGKVSVADPFACIVGCSSCANVCKPGAIIFPPRSILDAYTIKPPGQR